MFARGSVAIAVALFFITIGVFMRVPLLSDMGRDLNISPLGLGAIGSVFAFGRLVTDIPAGRLTERFPAQGMILVSASMIAIGSFILAVAPVAAFLYVAVFILGVGSASTLTTAMVHFAAAPRKNRGVAMSLFSGALLVGQAIGPSIGGLVGDSWGWRTAMFASAAIVLFLGIPPTRFGEPSRRQRVSRETPSPGDSRYVRTVLYLMPATQFASGAALTQTLVPIVADQELGFTAGNVGLAIGAGGLFRLLAALSSGWAADNLGRRYAMLPGLALQFSGVLVFAFVGGTVGWLLAIALVMLGSVSTNIGTTILADITEGSALGKRLGYFRFVGDAGMIVAPILAGWLYEVAGRTAATLPLLAFTGLVLLAATRIPETR